MAKKTTEEFDIDAWMEDAFQGVSLDEHKRNAIREVMAQPSVRDKLKAGTMRRDEFSRKLDEMAAEKQRLQEEQDQFRKNHEQTLSQYSAWEQQAKQTLADSEAARIAAEQERSELQAKLKKMAETYDADLDELGINLGGPVNGKPPDLSKYLTAEQLEERLSKLQPGSDNLRPSVEINMKLMDMAAEHRKMFGTDLNMDALYQEHLRTKKPLDTVWKQTYKVDEKREELAAAERKRIEDEIRADERRKTIEAMSNVSPFVRSDNVESPALRKFGPSGEALKNQPGMSPAEKAAARWETQRQQKLADAAAARAARAS